MESFENIHIENRDAARENLRKTSELLILEHECECVRNLDILIEEEYTKLRKLLDEQIKNIEINGTLYIIKMAFTSLGIGIGTAAFNQLTLGGVISKIWK